MTVRPKDAGGARSEVEAPDEEPAEGATTLLEALLAEEEGRTPALASQLDGVVIGRVVSVEANGVARVSFLGAPTEGFAARAMIALAAEDVGREVALMFEGKEPTRPLVMGKLVSPLAAGAGEATADGRRVEVSAEDEIVLRCGEASITLTRAGKIILRGAYVLSRSSGVNRIQGGSVEIN